MIVVSVVSMVGGVFALVPAEELRRYEAELNEQQQELQSREGSCGSVVAAGNCADGVAPSLRCEDHTRGHSLREGGDAPNNSHTSLDCGVREGNGVACDGHQGQL
ncbi:hypothetical protein LSM04_005275 [Trypanosoma melophagium]|nr:hypothetical protein LSM04_005275 [Trypanosoma melophagium]